MRRTGFARKPYAPARAPVAPIPAETAQRIRYAESAANAQPVPRTSRPGMSATAGSSPHCPAPAAGSLATARPRTPTKARAWA